jgi:hypothetical protein
MGAFGVGAATFASLMAGSWFGSYLRQRLPEHHLSEESREVVKLASGLIATMTALVLGLVIASAKSQFDEQDTAVKRIAADVLVLDRLLARYGPETGDVRAELRDFIADRLSTVWRSRDPVHEQETADASPAERIEDAIRALPATTHTQRWLRSQALDLTGDVLKTRWFMLGAAGNSIPTAFLVVLICWLTIIFASFGLCAPRNGTVFGVLLIAGLSVSAAIILILELDRPFDGTIRVSDAPLTYMMKRLGQ